MSVRSQTWLNTFLTCVPICDAISLQVTMPWHFSQFWGLWPCADKNNLKKLTVKEKFSWKTFLKWFKKAFSNKASCVQRWQPQPWRPWDKSVPSTVFCKKFQSLTTYKERMTSHNTSCLPRSIVGWGVDVAQHILLLVSGLGFGLFCTSGSVLHLFASGPGPTTWGQWASGWLNCWT